MRQKQQKSKAVDISNLVYGKVPPHATELECAVFGALMLEKSAIDIVAEVLKPECFYKDTHQRIYGAMVRLQQKSQPIDLLTVVDELRVSNDLEAIGGPYYIIQLTNAVVSAANVEAHCRIIKQKFMAREMIRISGQTVVDAYDEGKDIFELMAEHEKQITELAAGGISKPYTSMDAALVESYKVIEAMRANSDHITGVPSGTELDHYTHGWQKTDLIILAARPAVGKTAFALQLARHAATNHFKPTPVLFFSLEMSTQQLTQRILSAESEIPLEKIRNGKMDDDDMKQLFRKGMAKLAKARIFIDDSAGLSIYELKARARRMKRTWLREYGTEEGMIIVDYLQLMSGSGSGKGNREQEISEISRGLKQLAKELKIPVIALSQLSRQVEQRTGDKKMPQLSDLRESGAIEQDADMVMFIYRPEYYDINADQMGESTKGETHIRIAKHRNGSLETVKLEARLSIQRFYEWQGDAFKATPQSGFRPVQVSNYYETEKDNPF